jgi:hypothetical protein
VGGEVGLLRPNVNNAQRRVVDPLGKFGGRNQRSGLSPDACSVCKQTQAEQACTQQAFHWKPRDKSVLGKLGKPAQKAGPMLRVVQVWNRRTAGESE